MNCKKSKGRAETTRLLLAAAEAEYTDVRFDSTAFAGPSARGNSPLTFAEFKSTSPFGQVPVLQVADDVRIGQSRAIERFVARRFGLFGATPLQSGQIDATAELLRDLQDAFERARALQQLHRLALDELRSVGALLRDQLARSNGFLVGSSISYADLAFFYLFHDVVLPAIASVTDDLVHADLLAAVPPALSAHVKKISRIPSIEHYLSTRPIRPF